MPIVEATNDSVEAIITAAVDTTVWRHGARWVLDTWDFIDDTQVLVTVRASMGVWTNGGATGIVVHVDGGALHKAEGRWLNPSLLHGYVLCVTRSDDGADTIARVDRLVLSCPGEHRCHRGGCPRIDSDAELELLSVPVAVHAEVAATALGHSGWSRVAYNDLYGSESSELGWDDVVELLEAELRTADWKVVERSTWEGGLEDLLVRRGDRCLVIRYDRFTRQVSIGDGKSHLDGLLDALAEEGAIAISDDGNEVVDTSPEMVEQWGLDTLTAAHDHLLGHIADVPHLATPLQMTLLGLHPHADGTIRAPNSDPLVTLSSRPSYSGRTTRPAESSDASLAHVGGGDSFAGQGRG